MAVKNTKVLKATNQQIMNAIRDGASLSYQQRIPEADQGDARDTMALLSQYRPLMNEAADALVNRVALVEFRSKTYRNPLARFKRGLLTYGETIEEIALGLLKARRFDPNNCYDDPFRCSPAEVMANYHHINRQDQYLLSIDDVMLRRAFTDEYGLTRLVNDMLALPYVSDETDEYLIMRNLFRDFEAIHGFFKVNVVDASAATTPDERKFAAMQIVEAVRATAGDMSFMRDIYNPAGNPTATDPSKLVLFCTPAFAAMLSVNVVAFAFNEAAANVPFEIVQVDDFGIDGCQAILVDEDWFVCADTYIDFESLRNPAGRRWNYFLNHDGIYSASTFINAVMFTTQASTVVPGYDIKVTGVSVDYATPEGGTKPTYAPKGDKTRMIQAVAGSVTPAEPGVEVPQAVVWTLTDTDQPLKARTFIDPEGMLHVAEDEAATHVTVNATSTWIDPNTPIDQQAAITGSLVVGLGAPYTPHTSGKMSE